MAYIEWKNEYSVRIPQIDAQHRRLVSLLNELYEAMRLGKGRDVIERILSNLVQYAHEHFSEEEQLMQTHQFPGLRQHALEHGRFIDRVDEFYQQYTNGQAAISVQVSAFLKDWLINHILKTDQQYSDFLVAAGVK